MQRKRPEKPKLPPARERCLTACWADQSHTTMEGLRLYYREGKYEDAIAAFDRALADRSLACLCMARPGRLPPGTGAKRGGTRSITKALELAPADEEILYTCGETLQKMGILRE